MKHSQDVEPILDSIVRDREIMRNDGDFANSPIGFRPSSTKSCSVGAS